MEGRRPYWTLYKAEAILGYRVSQVNNRSVVSQVRLHETVEMPTGEFSAEEKDQVRVLELAGTVDDDGEQVGVRYQQRLFRKDESGKWYDATEEVTGQPAIVPTMNSATLQAIPFIFFGPRDLLPHINKPVLLDLANKNLDHYRLDADYKHGLHFVALPTPWARGVTAEEIEAGHFDAVGPTNIWMTTSADADFGMLEFQGAGLDAIKTALERAESHMATLGARMLAPEKRQVETAETANIHRMGENSVLSSMAQAVSMGLTRALEWSAEWVGVSPENVSVDLNRDFLPQTMDSRQIEALLKTWQAGGMSKQSLFDNLQRGEVIDSERTFEDEEADIQDEQPAMPEPANAAE
jgi:hypothetical protein